MKTLLIFRSSPMLGTTLQEGLDLALVMALMEQPVSILLQEAAVHMLSAAQAPVQGRRHLGKLLASLPLYGIERLYLSPSPQFPVQVEAPWRIVDAAMVAQLWQEHDEVWLW